MRSFLKNYKGSALIGVLIAVIIIAALVYGGVFFWKGNDANIPMNTNDTNIKSPAGAIGALEQAKKDIAEIQDNLNKQAEQLEATEFDEYTIKVTNINPGDNLISPITIEGEGVAFENTLIVELRNLEHGTMVKEFVTVKAPDVGKSGPFKITLDFDFDLTKEGFVAVYEESAKDGREVNLVEIPVKFINN